MQTGLSRYERQAATIARDLRLLREDRNPAPHRSAVDLARDLGLALDPWQAAALGTPERNVLLLCSRQAGKSTVSAVAALHQAVFAPGSLVLIISPTERQSKRLLRTVRRFYGAVQSFAPAVNEGVLTLELRNGSEIHALPGKEATIRGFAHVDLLLADEAARIPDELYSAVRPMLALSRGKLIALSTPFGKRGWFWREWESGGPAWHRTRITAYDVPRIPRDWLEEERQRIGDWWFRQEFLCEFLDSVDAFFRGEDIAAMASDDVRPLFAEVA